MMFIPVMVSVSREGPLPSCVSLELHLLLLLSVDRGHLVQAVLLGFEPQVGDAVGHVHSLGRVGVGAGGRVGGHGAERQEKGWGSGVGGKRRKR